MTFDELEIDPLLMRELYPDLFAGDITDSELKLLKKRIALDTLKNDLRLIFRLQPEQEAALGDIAAKYTSVFSTALMYLQCYFYFVEIDDVENKNALRKRECLLAYNNLKAGFGDLYTETADSPVMGNLQRG